MDESRYQKLADSALGTIERMLEDVDAEVVDVERAGDVVTLTFANGKKCVINTQRPTRQIWLAANARAWHFSFDEASAKWLDDKGRTRASDGKPVELFAHVASIVKEQAGVDLPPG
jgi:CyaY protein